MTKLKNINEADFNAEVLQSPIPVAVDFFGDYCQPCRILHPILESLADELSGKAKIVAVNVVENQELVGRLGLTVVPTILVYRAGEEVRRFVGINNLAELREALEA